MERWIFHLLFHFQMASTAMAREGQIQDTETPCRSSTWGAEAQVSVPSTATLPGMLTGSCLKTGVAETQTGTQIRGARVVSCGLTCCTTKPDPIIYIIKVEI